MLEVLPLKSWGVFSEGIVRQFLASSGQLEGPSLLEQILLELGF